MLADAEEALSGVRGVEEVSAEDCFYNVEHVTSSESEAGAMEEEDA